MRPEGTEGPAQDSCVNTKEGTGVFQGDAAVWVQAQQLCSAYT